MTRQRLIGAVVLALAVLAVREAGAVPPSLPASPSEWESRELVARAEALLASRSYLCPGGVQRLTVVGSQSVTVQCTGSGYRIDFDRPEAFAITRL